MSNEQPNEDMNNKPPEEESRSEQLNPSAIVEELLDLMGFDVGVNLVESGGVQYIDIDAGEDNDLVIGKDNKSLEALQHIVTRALAAGGHEGEVRVDVGGRRVDRDEELLDLTEDLVDECIDSGDAVYSPMLYASERRVVHRRAAELGGVETVSVGHGAKKRVRIEAV